MVTHASAASASSALTSSVLAPMRGRATATRRRRHRARRWGAPTRAAAVEGDGASAGVGEDGASASASEGEGVGEGRPVIVLDGANIAWGYSAALHAAFGSKNKQPLSRGVLAALAHEDWAKIDADVVCFVPSTYVEGPLHGLADGGDLSTVVAKNVRYLGGGAWRNEKLYAEVERGRVVLVERPAGKRSADDLKIIDYAREREARIISNDRYNDHKMGVGSLKAYLKSHLFDYEFVFGTDKKRIEHQAEAVEVCVGSKYLPSPPVEESEGTNGEWSAEVHASGSSRPWARYAKDALWGKNGQPRMKKRRSMGKAVRAPQLPAKDLGFPFWALDDEFIPCVLNPSCKF